MKSFISQNWYKLSLAVSLFIFAIGFSVLALKYNIVQAGTPKPASAIEKNKEDQFWIVGCGNSIYKVTYNTGLGKYEFNHIGPESNY